MLKSELVKIVKNSKSLRQVAKQIGKDHNTTKKILIEKNIDFSHFTHGRTSEGMVGEQYGMLTVITVYSLPNEKHRRKYASCKCQCGNIKEKVRCDAIADGTAYSCGCHSKNRWNASLSKNHSFKGVGEFGAVLFKQYKRGAIRRNIDFNITIKYAWSIFEKQNKKCALTGVELRFGRVRRGHETTASIDRIDSSKGYVKGNIQWVLKDINLAKGCLDNDYFIKLCNLVAKNCPKRVKKADKFL